MALLPILILMIYPGIDYSISFGWHTEILSEKSLETFIGLGLLAIITSIYWIINRRQINTNNLLTFTHFILTITPIYWFLLGDEIIGFLIGEDLEKINQFGEFLMNALFICYLSLIIGQILYFINIGIGIKNKMAAHNTI
jgi:hypothetical protein